MASTAGGSMAASLASKTKTKKKHFVAQKVKLFRASDPLLSVLMWGVNHSVSMTSDLALRDPGDPRGAVMVQQLVIRGVQTFGVISLSLARVCCSVSFLYAACPS